MLVKNVHKYLPSKIFEGIIAISSTERKFNFIKTLKIINKTTFTIINRVFKLKESKKFFFFFGLIL
jgi:hypothetical protein